VAWKYISEPLKYISKALKYISKPLKKFCSMRRETSSCGAKKFFPCGEKFYFCANGGKIGRNVVTLHLETRE